MNSRLLDIQNNDITYHSLNDTIDINLPHGKLFLLPVAGLDGAEGGAPLEHEAEQAGEDGADRPGRVPGVGVVVGDGETQPRVSLEPAVGRDHEDGRRLEGELGGEDELAVVAPAAVQRVVRPRDHVMPLQDVGGQRLGHDVGDRVLARGTVWVKGWNI